MRRYRLMVDWWEHNGPPVYVAAAGYLGLLKPKSSKAKDKSGKPIKQDTGNLNDLLKMAGPGGMFH